MAGREDDRYDGEERRDEREEPQPPRRKEVRFEVTLLACSEREYSACSHAFASL